MSFKNIVLGSSNKSYTHDLSFDNNTTMEFGVLQPLLSQFMFPKSSIKVNTRQLVRLAPMPTPSFARMYLANFASFVKMTDVVPYHESLLSKIPYSSGSTTFLPTRMPFTSNHSLLYFLLNGSYVSLYKGSTASHDFTLVQDNSTYQSALNLFSKEFFGTSITSDNPLWSSFNWVDHPESDLSLKSSISPVAADISISITTTSATLYLFCFKFNAASSRLRKILIGLGYTASYKDTLNLSVAPLLAFYKAYYDRFGLVRDIPFETTSCFKLIKFIESYNIDYTLSSSVTDYKKVFKEFLLNELANCWYTSPNSYIAAHRSSLSNGTPIRSFIQPIEQFGSSTVGNDDSISTSMPVASEVSSFTQLSLDLLKRLTSFVNKDSAIGKRMSEWVRVHYGADVSNSLFEESNRINEWQTPIDIDDVFSTSDTADLGTSNKGEYLGAYAGKGSGFSSNGFSFRAPVHGFVFVMSCIVPLANTFQGIDPTLLAVDLDSIPQPEFDALGFEATPRSVFFSHNSVGCTGTSKLGSTFGFVPRYTGFKVKKNVVNGDMYKGYYQTDLLPYFNDRIFYDAIENVSDIVTDESSQKIKSFSYFSSANLVPDASTEFQKICKYGFMGDFNRLFYNKGELSSSGTEVSLPSDDNFIVQTVFDVRVSNWLKPVQNSYDTVDESIDNNTTSVSTI